MTGDAYGILALGSFIPRSRLPLRIAWEANRWFAPQPKPEPERRRSFCNWDEDALTMAVEASRSCLAEGAAADIGALELASTTLPFADRSNAGLIREALDLPESCRVQDAAGSLRAATAILDRLGTSASPAPTLLVASDCVDAKPASAQETQNGHGAAALLIGEGDPVAEFVGSARRHQDFVDHYRMSGERFDYALESRWARDEGFADQIVAEVTQALDAAGLAAADVATLAVSAPGGLGTSVARRLAGATGVPAGGSKLDPVVGFCAAAHPLLVLVEAIESAEPGDVVLLVALGQGVDVQLYRVRRSSSQNSIRSSVADGEEETNYTRYLAMRRLLRLETGIRAERDNRTAMSAYWRKHEAINAFKGGLCSACNTLQFPPSKVCVSCGAEDSQTLEPMADMPGQVRSFTEDWLAYTPKPPLVFGNVGFDKGANVLMEFADVAPGELQVGMPVRLRFRIKDFDDRRGFRRYFWKPVPVREAARA